MQVSALRGLHLNVRRAKVKHADGNVKNRFYVTDSQTADKIMKSARLEEIRLSILQNLQFYHPEAGDKLAWGKRAKKATKRSQLEPLGLKKRWEPGKMPRCALQSQQAGDEPGASATRTPASAASWSFWGSSSSLAL